MTVIDSASAWCALYRGRLRPLNDDGRAYLYAGRLIRHLLPSINLAQNLSNGLIEDVCMVILSN